MKTIKSKIGWGVIFLFAVILLNSFLGILFISQLSLQSKGTIIDNYSSVDYTMKMINAASEMHAYQTEMLYNKSTDQIEPPAVYNSAVNDFNKNLENESQNITEKNEKQLVDSLEFSYRDYINLFNNLKNKDGIAKPDIQRFNESYSKLLSNVFAIYKVNMNAVNYKSNKLQSTADNVIIYMAIVAAVSILITLFFIFTFPSKIVKPIKQLTEKIKSISERNYEQKLELNTKDELGELANAFNIMAERLKQYEAKQIDRILFEQKRLESVIQNFEDGILFINENRKIVLINNAVAEITGLNEKDILNKTLQEISEGNDLAGKIYASVAAANSRNETDIKPIAVVLQGKEYYFNIESEEIITYSESEKKETFIGNLVLIRNITKYQERDKAKTNLLATASHELKTPLSSINLSLKLLSDKRIGDLNVEQKGLLESLNQQSKRLSGVINDLLNYSQIETGNIKLNFTSVKPDVITDIGITALMMQISEKDIVLNTSIEDSLPDIKADVEKLVFVFVNILNNAVRYSKKGDLISINVVRKSDDILFSIKDNGPGISETDQELLFQRFSQVGKKTAHGWGLGLAISKEFMQAQNGRIWVESEVGKGSKFIFSMPVV